MRVLHISGAMTWRGGEQQPIRIRAVRADGHRPFVLHRLVRPDRPLGRREGPAPRYVEAGGGNVDDTLGGHFLGRHADIVPHHADDWNVDIRQDIYRHAENYYRR